MKTQCLKKADEILQMYDAVCAYAKCLLHHFCKIECDSVDHIDIIEDMCKVICRCKTVDGNVMTTSWHELPLDVFADPFAYAEEHMPDDVYDFCADMKHSSFLELAYRV